MKKVKVAFIIPSLEIGGAELQTINHINYLVEHQCDVYLIILSSTTDLLEELQISKENILVLQNASAYYDTSTIKGIIPFIPKITTFIRKKEIKNVFAVMNLSHLVARLAKLISFVFLYKFQLIIYHRCAFYKEFPPNTFPKKILNLFNRLISWITDTTTVFISKDVESDIERNSSPRKGRVIYNSVRFTEVHDQLAKDHLRTSGISRPEYMIVFPGRFHEHKGHREFFLAFKRFLSTANLDSKQVGVILLGEGYLLDKVKTQVEELKIDSHCVFLGKQSHELVLSYMSVSNLVVVPSNHEGFGNVAIEALMCRANLLTSDAGGLREIIIDKENGYLFKKGDIDDLAMKLAFFYSKKNERILDKDLIFADYQKRFSLETQMKQLIDLIQE